ncbi:MAG: hypothetical protein ACRD3S_14080, partial [Terracidiphilus sp.]
MRQSKLATRRILLGCCLIGIVTRALSADAASPPSIFVANQGSVALSAYPGGSFGNVLSQVTNPELVNPEGIARDFAGNIYVANPNGVAVTVYAAGVYGAPNPIAVITGPNTALDYPIGVGVDSGGNIYVLNCGTCGDNTDDSIAVFPPGSNGNVTPAAVITGAST